MYSFNFGNGHESFFAFLAAMSHNLPCHKIFVFRQLFLYKWQGTNARKVNCGRVYSVYNVHIETSSLWAEFVNKYRRISIHFVFEEV